MADAAQEIKRWDQRVDWTSNELSTRLMVVGMKQEIAELRAALASRPAEVDDEGLGYKMLPVVPTDAMCIAARKKIGVGSNVADHIYRAMVAAAPSHTTNKEK